MTPGSSRNKFLSKKIQGIDAGFRAAGLTRSGRAGREPAPKKQRFTPDGLSPSAEAPVTADNGVVMFQAPRWKKTAWLWHGFSTRQGGVSRAYCGDGAAGELNLGFTAEDTREAVLMNRRLLAEAVSGEKATPLIALRQFHSNLLSVASSADAGRDRARRADGLMTAEPGLLLAIQTADCIPILVADRRQRVVAAFHAGWRGTVRRIVELGIGRMRAEFGSQPKDLMAAIGPGIRACCYAVGEEVFSNFESQFAYGRELFHEVYDSDPIRTKYPLLFLTQRAPGHSPTGPSLHVDLTEANRRQLVSAGLDPRSIQIVGGCTNCGPDLYFSYRGARGHTGRMMSIIGVRAD